MADVAFFAPLGLALDAGRLVPDLAERGRRELQRRIDSAALVGRLALRYGPAFVGGAARGWGQTGFGNPAGPRGPEGPFDSGGRTGSANPAGPGGAGSPFGSGSRAGSGRPDRPASSAGPTGRQGRAGLADDSRPWAQAVAGQPTERSGPSGEPATGPTGLAIPGYDALSALQVVGRLAALGPEELAAVAAYERAHRGRRTILAKAAQLAGASAPGAPGTPERDPVSPSRPGAEGKSPP